MNLDTEILAKVKEVYKQSLKHEDIDISFEVPSKKTDIEILNVVLDEHYFKLKHSKIPYEQPWINYKYHKWLPKKIKKISKELDIKKAIKLQKKKTWYLFLLYPFYGKRFNSSILHEHKYIINYNGVIMSLKKREYDKYTYYAKYVYKVNQLYTLNTALGINQKFNVVFDDDIVPERLMDNLYNDIKGIIKPPKD
jgi:hypothetical protein